MLNKIIKKYIIFGGLIVLLAVPLLAGAIDILNPLSTEGSIRPPIECDNIVCVIEKIINLITIIAFSIAPIIIVIAGFYFVISGGDPEKVSTAKKIIINTVIGLLVILLSRAFVAVIQSIF